MAKQSIQQKREFAKMLYLNNEGISQKEIAQRAGVSEVSVSKWIKLEKWDTLKVSLLTTKAEQLNLLYNQLSALNDDIKSRESKYASNKEADTIIKITAAIRNLEIETSIAEKVETGQQFLSFVRKVAGLDLSKDIAKYFDAYIKSCM